MRNVWDKKNNSDFCKISKEKVKENMKMSQKFFSQIYLQECPIVCWQLWNFIVMQAKFDNFCIKMNILKDFFDVLQSKLIKSTQVTFLLHKIGWTWINIKTLLLKVCLQVWYSLKKSFSWWVEFRPKKWLRKLKLVNIWQKIIWMQKFYWISSATIWNSKTVITLVSKFCFFNHNS